MSESPEEKKPRKYKKKVILTDRQKREMFERWDTGRYTQLELALWYGCGETQIWSLIQRREELGPLREDDAQLYDALDLKNLEDALNTISGKIAKLTSKPSLSEGDRMQIATLTRAAKTMLDIRKQLKELPKDLKDRVSVPIDKATSRRLIELIPPENREEYIEIMQGLTQSQRSESDLDALPSRVVGVAASRPPASSGVASAPALAALGDGDAEPAEAEPEVEE